MIYFINRTRDRKDILIMEELSRYIPLLIPLLIIQLILMVAALIDIIRNRRTRGPEWVWILVVVFVATIGPIIYFIAGKEEA
jgi:hypothetical protein